MTTMRARLTLLGIALLAGCQPEPQPIRYGEDACAHCRMTVSDPRFGSELLTSTGKAHTFDSVECMAEFVHDHPDIADQTHSLWVSAFNNPGELISLDEAFVLHASTIRSPMGGGLAAFGPGMTPEAALNAFGGDVLSWDEVVTLASSREGRMGAANGGGPPSPPE